MHVEKNPTSYALASSIVEAGIWSTQGMGVMFCMLDQRQSADDHFTIEYVYSHASETQDEAKAPRYDPKAFRKWNF